MLKYTRSRTKADPRENPTPQFQKIREQVTTNLWNVQDQYKDLSLTELQAVQSSQQLDFAICTLSLTGDLNVGMIMRTACLMGAKHMIIFGRRRYDKRTTVGAHNYIPVTRVDGLTEQLEFDVDVFNNTMQKFNYAPIFVETGGTPIRKIDWCSIDRVPCLVVGNEGIGCPDYLIGNHPKVSIDQRGVLRSLNVAVAAGIAMYELSQALS